MEHQKNTWKTEMFVVFVKEYITSKQQIISIYQLKFTEYCEM